MNTGKQHLRERVAARILRCGYAQPVDKQATHARRTGPVVLQAPGTAKPNNISIRLFY